VLDSTKSLIVPIPDGVSYEQAAQLTGVPISAFGILDISGVQKGDILLQSAASSSLGRAIIQIAKSKGIKTINVVRRDDNINNVIRSQSSQFFNCTKEDVPSKVKEITQGAGVKHAFDAVGGKTALELEHSLAYKGTLLLYGVLSSEPFELDITTLLKKAATVTTFMD